MRNILLILLVMSGSIFANAQLPDKLKSKKLSVKIINQHAAGAFNLVEKKVDYKFCFSDSDIDKSLLMTFDFKLASLQSVLDKISLLTGLQFKLINRYICVYRTI